MPWQLAVEIGTSSCQAVCGGCSWSSSWALICEVSDVFQFRIVCVLAMYCGCLMPSWHTWYPLRFHPRVPIVVAPKDGPYVDFAKQCLRTLRKEKTMLAKCTSSTTIGLVSPYGSVAGMNSIELMLFTTRLGLTYSHLLGAVFCESAREQVRIMLRLLLGGLETCIM